MGTNRSLASKALLAAGVFIGGIAGTGFLLTAVWVSAADLDGTGTGSATAVLSVAAVIWTAIWATALVLVVAMARRQGQAADTQDTS